MAKPPVALFIFTNNVDDYLPNIEREKKQIREALELYQETNRMMIVMESFTSLKELKRLFKRYEGRIVLFHYSGHADDNSLQLNNDIINTNKAYAGGISSYLEKEAKKKLRLAFLNGCSTQPQVDALKAIGIKNIIATNFPISDNQALHFATDFYQTMANDAKDNPFKEKPITIEQGFESAKSYLKSTYQNPIITDNYRGFRFEDTEVSDIPWELYTETPDWYLPNVHIRNWVMIALVVVIPLIIGFGINEYLFLSTEVDLKVTLDNQTPNAELPPLNATLTIEYKGETKKRDSVTKEITFRNLIRSRKDEVYLSFEADGFVNRDTTFKVTKGIVFPVWRDDYYSNIMGKIIDEDGKPIENAQITVLGETKPTNSVGVFKLKIPFGKQRAKQNITVIKEGYHTKNFDSIILPNEEMKITLIED